MKKYEKMLLEEPAKFFGWVVGGVITVSAVLVAILQNVVGVLPSDWKEEINSALATIVLIGLVATRIQAVLTRANVYAPATVMNYPNLPPIDGSSPGPTPQAGPQTEKEIKTALEQLRAKLGVDNDGGN